jgi:hypothetical protein
VSGILLAQSDPFIGTWKLNAAKSKFSPGPAPQSTTRTYEAQGSGLKISNDGTAADGSRIAYNFTANYDGKDNQISGTGVAGGADTIALKRINATTVEAATKRAGKVNATTRNVLSKDGKSFTATSKGKDANGKPTSSVAVWEKQ